MGSALASIGRPIPAVVAASVVLGLPLVLGLESKDMVMLGLTFLVGSITLASGRTNVMQGAVHLVIFAAFLFLALWRLRRRPPRPRRAEAPGRLPPRPALRGFAQARGWFAQIGLFVMLGLLAWPAHLPPQLLPAVLLGLVLLLLSLIHISEPTRPY